MQGKLPANRLRLLRVEKGLKLYDIATRVRVDPATIHRWESGESPVPDAAKLALADFYKVTPAFLMGWREKVPV